MKIQAGKKVHLESGPNMTPLVDVVMVILIFLMLCGSFKGNESYLESTLPVKKSGGGGGKVSAADEVQVDIRVDVSINAETRKASDWKVKFGDKVVEGNVDTLKEELTKKLNTYKNAGTSVDKLQVILSPNSQVKWKWLTIVYTAALDAGFKKVGFGAAG